MVLLGVIPGPKTKNPQAYLRIVADQFDALREGIMVFDAYSGTSVCVRVYTQIETIAYAHVCIGSL